MMARIPQSWLTWVFENVQKNVKRQEIVRTMVKNGFNEDIANVLIDQTRAKGLLVVAPCFADSSTAYYVPIRS
jgi:hypothetical protein